MPGQGKSGLFTTFRCPGLQPEGDTGRNRVKERRSDNRFCGCDQYVTFDQTRNDWKIGEIFCENTHQRKQENNQPLFVSHPIWYEFNPHLLWRVVLWIPWGREIRTRISNWRIQIWILGGPSRLLPFWKSQANFLPYNLPWHLSR